MASSVNDALATFHLARQQTLAMMAPLSQEQLDWPPGPGRWSVGEVVDHLVLSEGLFRKDIAALIELQKSGRKAEIVHTFSDFNTAPTFVPQSLLPMFEIPFTMMNMFMPKGLRDMMVRNRMLSF